MNMYYNNGGQSTCVALSYVFTETIVGCRTGITSMVSYTKPPCENDRAGLGCWVTLQKIAILKKVTEDRGIDKHVYARFIVDVHCKRPADHTICKQRAVGSSAAILLAGLRVPFSRASQHRWHSETTNM